MPQKKKKVLEGEVVQLNSKHIPRSTRMSLKEYSLSSVMGFLLISIGLAHLLAYYLPVLPLGFAYVLVGILFLLLSLR